jgi:ParB/RepB/Spo0J family partition protein
MTTFQMLPLSALVESDRNPRTSFDHAKLSELAASIKAVGVHTPILVRPLPGRRVPDTGPGITHEIIAGARRFRASLEAEETTIPAVIHDMDDNAALEAAIVENLQREGLSELDEAEGYEALMKHSGLNADQVGAKIGKSRSYVYGRLKLLDLCPEAREAMHGGKMDASKGLLVARIPDHKLQMKAVAAITKPNWQNEQISVRAASDWLRQNVMLRLADAPFKTKDAALIPAAGSCTDCPKRTGANPELFADVDSPDVCTDTKCYQKKVDAHTDKLAEKARAKGLEVISGKEAKQLKPNSWTSPKDMDDLDRVVWVNDGDERKQKSLRSALTKEELQGQVKALIDPHTHKVVEVIPKTLGAIAEDRLRQSTEATGASESHQARRREAEAADLEKEYHTRWRARAHQVIDPRIVAEEINKFQAPMLRALLTWMSDDPDWTALEHAMDKPDLDDYAALHAEIAVLPDARLGITILRALLWQELDVQWGWNNGARVLDLDTPVMSSCAEVLAIDLDAIRAEVQVEMREELEEKQRVAAAEKAAKRSAAEPSAAQAGGGGGSKSKKKTPAAPAAKKLRTSPEEAMQGIAAAMQGAEGAADDGRTGQVGSVMQDSAGADIEVGHRVEVVGDELKGKWGKVASITSTNVFVVLDGLTADYCFQADELKSHGNAKLNPVAAWPFPPKSTKKAVAA